MEVSDKTLEKIRELIYDSSATSVDVTEIFDHEEFDSGFPPIDALALGLLEVSDEEPYVTKIGDGAYTQGFYVDDNDNVWELLLNMDRFELVICEED